MNFPPEPEDQKDWQSSNLLVGRPREARLRFRGPAPHLVLRPGMPLTAVPAPVR